MDIKGGGGYKYDISPRQLFKGVEGCEGMWDEIGNTKKCEIRDTQL